MLGRDEAVKVVAVDRLIEARLLGFVLDVGEPDRPVGSACGDREVVLGSAPGESQGGVLARDGNVAVEKCFALSQRQFGGLEREGPLRSTYGDCCTLGSVEASLKNGADHHDFLV